VPTLEPSVSNRSNSKVATVPLHHVHVNRSRQVPRGPGHGTELAAPRVGSPPPRVRPRARRPRHDEAEGRKPSPTAMLSTRTGQTPLTGSPRAWRTLPGGGLRRRGARGVEDWTWLLRCCIARRSRAGLERGVP